MAIDIYMRDINSSDRFLLHTAETVEEAKDIIKHVQEIGIYLDESGDSTRTVAAQYVVDADSTYLKIVVG